MAEPKEGHEGRSTDDPPDVPEYWELALDYPVRPVPRWGYGRPIHGKLRDIIGRHRARYEEVLGSLLRYREDLATIPIEDTSPSSDIWWNNGWLGGMDIAALHTFIRDRRPRWYAEVGSGFSTLFAARAIERGSLPTRILSIDPQPRHDVDVICDVPVRVRLEEADLSLFDRLGSGDMLFVDGSHRCLTNSDVTVMFLDILPALPPGILVGFDDVFLPKDYPPEWHDRFYSEQYLLASALLAEGGRFEPVFAAAFAEDDRDLAAVLNPLWEDSRMRGADRTGKAFWFETR